MKKGSIKVSVLYPKAKGKHFDMQYYSKDHVGMVAKLLGNSVLGATVEQGLSGSAPGSAPEFEAIGNLYLVN